MDLNKKNIIKILCIITFTVLLLVSVQNIDKVFSLLGVITTILAPFIIGGTIAFILNVPMRFIERKLFSIKKLKPLQKYKRLISILLVILFVISMLLIVLFLIIPELINTFTILKVAIPRFASEVQVKAQELGFNNMDFNKWLNDFNIDWNQAGSYIINFLENGAGSIFSSTVGVVSSLISGVTNFFIGFIFSIYILSQKEKLKSQSKKIMYSFIEEEKVDRILSILSLSDKTFSRFLSGQCTEAVILGTMFFISMTILRFDHALLIGVLIGFTALIPIFGAFAGCFVGAFLILMINPMQAVWFVILFLVLQQIEGNLIYPHVVGGSVGLPSIWVLFAVTIGGSTMGVIGMVINIPLCSIVYTLLREMVNKRIDMKKISNDKIS